MKRSLEHGKNSSRVKIELEELLKRGTLCHVLADLVAQAPALKHYQHFKDTMFAMTDTHNIAPTINVCRVWTTLSAWKHITAKDWEQWASTLGLNDQKSADASEMKFDIHNPNMFMVFPSIDEEEAADDTNNEPTREDMTPTEQMGYDMSKKFDANTLAFPRWFCECWGSDYMFELIQTSVDQSVELFSLWAKRAGATDLSGVGANTRAAIDDTATFASAYVAVCGSAIFTPESHSAFVQTFVSQRRNGDPTLKSLATAARKSKEFRSQEAKAIEFGSKELEYGEHIRSWDRKLTAYCDEDGTLTLDDLDTVLNNLPQWNVNCRSGAQELVSFDMKLVRCISKMLILDEAESSKNLDVDAQIHRLSALRNHVKYFDSTDADVKAEGIGLKRSIEDRLTRVSGDRAFTLLATMCEDSSHPLYTCPKFKKFINDCPYPQLATLPLGQIANMAICRLCTIVSDKEVSDADVFAKCFAGLANVAAIEVKLKEADLKLEFDQTLYNDFAKRAHGLHLAGSACEASPSKSTFTALNKAMLAWKGGRKVPADLPHLHDLVKEFIARLAPYIQTHTKYLNDSIETAEATLRGVVDEYTKIAGGTRDGSSWKASIDADMSVDDVLALANTSKTGLLAGPGAKVSGAKDVLDKAFGGEANRIDQQTYRPHGFDVSAAQNTYPKCVNYRSWECTRSYTCTNVVDAAVELAVAVSVQVL